MQFVDLAKSFGYRWLLSTESPGVFHAFERWKPPRALAVRHVTLCGTNQTTLVEEHEDEDPTEPPKLLCLICLAKVHDRRNK